MTAVVHQHGPTGPNSAVPLVLLHGFPLDARMWDDVIVELPAVPVLAVDLPGFGAAVDSAEPEGATLESFADAVAFALAQEQVRGAVIAGLSMGGYVAMALAERHPELFAGIALLDTKASADGVEARAARLAVARSALEEAGAGAVAPMVETLLGPSSTTGRPEVLEQVRTWLSQAPPAGIAAAQRAMASRPDRLDALALDVPALVLRGAEDGLATVQDHEQMAAALKVEVTTVPAVGHLSAVEDPASVAAALADLHQRAM